MIAKKKIFTSYYGNPLLPKKQEGLLFAISCGVPDYFKDIPKLEMFCPKGLLALHGHDFDVAYDKKLAALDKKEVIEKVSKLPDGAYLLCYEGPKKSCHRHKVAEYLRNLGFDIEEHSLGSSQTLQGRLKANLRGSSHENAGSNPAPAANLFD